MINEHMGFDSDVMLAKLRKDGHVNKINHMQYKDHNTLKLLIKYSGLAPGGFVRNLKIKKQNLTVWLEGDVRPTVRSMIKLRTYFGLILYMGSDGKLFPATPEGLENAIEYRKVTQAWLGEKTRIKPQQINRFVRRRTGSGGAGLLDGMTLDVWIKYAQVLKVRFYIPTVSALEGGGPNTRDKRFPKLKNSDSNSQIKKTETEIENDPN